MTIHEVAHKHCKGKNCPREGVTSGRGSEERQAKQEVGSGRGVSGVTINLGDSETSAEGGSATGSTTGETGTGGTQS